MATVRHAVHIRTGAPQMAQAVDIWLEAQRFEVDAHSDVYAAAVHLMTSCETVCEIAFVGGDWLADDELQIIRCLRETWPAVAIVCYAARPVPGSGSEPRVVTCVGAAALADLLRASPDELLARVRCDAGAWTRRVAPPEVAAAPARPRTPAAEPAPVLDRAAPVEPADADLDERGEDFAADELTPAAVETPLRVVPQDVRTILTAEELAALLEAADD